MMEEPFSCDVLGLGVAAIDDLVYVEAYPPPDVKTAVLRRERQCGGLTATALVAAARLGARCAYAGVLGDDEISAFVVKRFAEDGIDTRYLVRRQGAGPVHSLILVDVTHHTRNIFFDVGGAVGADPAWPPEAVIRGSRVLLVDHFGIAGMVRAARIARAAGIPVVADLERDDMPGFADLLALVDHPILSRAFAARLTGCADPSAAAQALWNSDRQTVVVTCGVEGCWYLDRDRGQPPRHQPAFPVKALDTTGCGDVFHGAYAAALARGLGVEERVRFASAAAALKATHAGGQAGIPDRRAVEAFVKGQHR